MNLVPYMAILTVALVIIEIGAPGTIGWLWVLSPLWIPVLCVAFLYLVGLAIALLAFLWDWDYDY